MRFFMCTALMVLAASPALATNVGPAPLIGLGVPALGAIGGVLLGSRVLLKSNLRHRK